MRHFRAYARLRADSKVIHHAVLRGEAFRADGAQVFVQPHEAFVDLDAPASGNHVPRAVGIVQEHGANGGLAGLADARFGNADDAHVKLPPCWMFWCIWKLCGFPRRSVFRSVSACQGHLGAGLRFIRVIR